MSIHAVHTDAAPAAVGPYAQAIRAGDLVITSGQIPLPVDGSSIPDGIEAQTRLALANLAAVLAAAGSSLDRVVKTTCFLTDMDDFAAMNAVYAEVFGEHRPARSTIGVVALPKGARVEIEATALATL